MRSRPAVIPICRATFDVDVPITLRVAPNLAVSAERRNELLEAIRDGRHVELEMDVVPFRQRAGERNRNFVRFREGALLALGRSGRGMPFLRDHAQDDIDAVGGEVLASSIQRSEAGDEYTLHQTVRLTAPWAVEKALRGLIKYLSIGWVPTGPVHCLICETDHQYCNHYPGQALDDERIVEFEFQNAELVETSVVAVPAVKGTSVDSIRAALSAARDITRGPPQEIGEMQKFANVLGLAATAGETEILSAVEAIKKKAEGLEMELAISDAERKTLASKVESYERDARQREEDSFIATALSSGRIDGSEEGMWRDFYAANPMRAAERLAERKPGARTPVGQPRQSANEPVDTAAPLSHVQQRIVEQGGSIHGVKAVLRQFGHVNPDEAMAKHLATLEG